MMMILIMIMIVIMIVIVMTMCDNDNTNDDNDNNGHSVPCGAEAYGHQGVREYFRAIKGFVYGQFSN